jgi:hypothetical protein
LLRYLPASWFATIATNRYEYDEQGRVRGSIDPCTDGDAKIPDEPNASGR